MKDYYSILGVSNSATEDDIKKAYRKIVLENHPDRNKSKEAHEKFKEATEAYSVLSDSAKRTKYDSGESDGQGSGFDFSSGGFSRGNSDDIGFDFQDLFNDFFGRSGFSQERNNTYLIGITLEECYSGITKELQLNVNHPCRNCKGKGFMKSKQCSKCHGSGRLVYTKNLLGMHFQTVDRKSVV